MAKKPSSAASAKTCKSSAKPRAKSTLTSQGKAGAPAPSKDTRFKPGQSGNPKGRPRKELSLLRHIEAELDAEIQVTEGGKSICLTKLQVLAKSMVNKALQGDHKALLALLRILPPAKSDEDEERALVPLETVLRFLDRKGQTPEEEEPARGDDQ